MIGVKRRFDSKNCQKKKAKTRLALLLHAIYKTFQMLYLESGFNPIGVRESAIWDANRQMKLTRKKRCDPAAVSAARETEGKAFLFCEADDGAIAPSPRQNS